MKIINALILCAVKDGSHTNSLQAPFKIVEIEVDEMI